MNPEDEQGTRQAAGVWSLDVRAWRVNWSPRAREIHDFSPDQPVSIWEAMDFIDRQDRARLFASALDCYRTGLPMELEVGLTTAAGRTKSVRITGFRASSGDLDLPVLKGTIRQLGQETSQGTQNEATAQRLLAVLREWEIFGRAIPHELASPLSIARGFAQALRDGERSTLSDTGRARLARLLKALDQLGGLLDSLLQFAPVATRPMQDESVSLSGLAREAIELLRAQDPGRDVQVEIEGELTARGDPDLLRLLIANLMGNAWKFTRHRASATIRFSALRTPQRTVYCVADNGAGFDMYDAPRLFTPFERLHERHHFDGSGVGLALVRRVVERHAGTLWAEACPGAGASFFFTLGTGVPSSSNRVDAGH